MATDFLLPSSAELQLVAQSLVPTLVMNDPIFKHFPITEKDAARLIWEQEAFYTGVQGIRGLNGQAGRVKEVGLNRFTAEPGVYGEHMVLDEFDMTERRIPGTFGTVIDATDLAISRQKQLLNRRINRIRQIAWNLASTGTYSVSQTIGGQSFVMATDSYTFQTYSAGVPWATVATATPLADLRAVKLLQRGYSVSFGRDATCYMNQTQFNSFIKNTNTADLFGRRTTGLATIENVNQLNQLLVGDDLPTIQVYDDNYRDDTGTVQLFLATNKAVVIGKRTLGDPVGEYRMTRNASNPNMAPGPFMKITDSADYGQPMPREIKIWDAHNGGPIIFQPSAIVIMSSI